MRASKCSVKTAKASLPTGYTGSTRIACSFESDLASLASLMPLLDQLSTEASNIIDNDTMSNSSLPVVPLQVDLPADDQVTPSTPLAVPEATAIQLRQMVSWIHPSTPHRPLSSALHGAHLRSAHRLLFLHIPSPPPISGCPTPSSIMTIVHGDNNWLTSTASHPRAPAISVKAPSAVPVKLELASASVGSMTSSGGAPSKLLYAVPLAPPR